MSTDNTTTAFIQFMHVDGSTDQEVRNAIAAAENAFQAQNAESFVGTIFIPCDGSAGEIKWGV